MTTETMRPADLQALVDSENGLVDRKIFSDEEIYRLELEHIFARAWNFMCHESMIPNPGDFFQTYIGEDRVIVVRDKEGGLQVLLNTCRHRGNAVCRADEGHATSFMCTYHGWTYDLQGKLVGVPGFKDYYHEDLDRDSWGLIRAAQVDSYRGFVFATLDPDAPSLVEYLGDTAPIGMNHLLARGLDQAVAGVMKWTIECNWKFAADNVWDFYHVTLTHASAIMSGWVGGTNRSPQTPSILNAPQIVVLGEYGHACGGPAFGEEAMKIPGSLATMDQGWRQTPEAKDIVGSTVGLRVGGHTHVFPNMWLMPNFNQISLRLPKGPTTTEIWWFTFVDANMSEDGKRAAVLKGLRNNGPSGMTEDEDGENWDQSTKGTMGTVARRFPLNYAMDLGHGQVVHDETGPPHIDTPHFTEHAQMWYYRSWADWMAAASWNELKANHSPIPTGTI